MFNQGADSQAHVLDPVDGGKADGDSIENSFGPARSVSGRSSKHGYTRNFKERNAGVFSTHEMIQTSQLQSIDKRKKDNRKLFNVESQSSKASMDADEEDRRYEDYGDPLRELRGMDSDTRKGNTEFSQGLSMKHKKAATHRIKKDDTSAMFYGARSS